MKKRIAAFKYAFNGIKYCITKETHFQIQLVAALVVSGFGFIFALSKWEWIVQIFCIGSVLMAEAFNTTLEKIADFIQPKKDTKIKIIKDVAAGAVLLMSITSVIIGIIYIPKIIN